MVVVSIGNETSPEANWNRQADRQADRQAGKPVYWEAASPKMSAIVWFKVFIKSEAGSLCKEGS